mmetsp:Transcript_50576/g.110083  ORF Transcript_50576/g.110083 Transcript_50576/m.110083 type:complete len:200 (+) Transcript_50576:748-1347(+)
MKPDWSWLARPESMELMASHRSRCMTLRNLSPPRAWRPWMTPLSCSSRGFASAFADLPCFCSSWTLASTSRAMETASMVSFASFSEAWNSAVSSSFSAVALSRESWPAAMSDSRVEISVFSWPIVPAACSMKDSSSATFLIAASTASVFPLLLVSHQQLYFSVAAWSASDSFSTWAFMSSRSVTTFFTGFASVSRFATA